MFSNKIFLLVLFLWQMNLFAWSNPVLSKKELNSLAYKSGFIFSGKILAADSALYKLPNQKNFVVVQVLTVYRAPEGFKYIGGRNVSVKLDSLNSSIKFSKDSLLFFSSGLYFGKTIGLAERVIINWKDYPVDFADTLKVIFHNVFNRDLRNHLKAADTIFKGTIVEVVFDNKKDSLIKEGEFRWATAKVKMLNSYKGNVKPGQIILVDFAGERDMELHFAPLLQKDGTGIFILDAKESADWGRDHAVAINRMDFYKPKDEKMILDLLDEIKY